MKAWEWDAPGPLVSACGIAGSEKTARMRAAVCLLSRQADTATVRPVLVRAGGTALTSTIVPAGGAVRGRRSGRGVSWKAA